MNSASDVCQKKSSQLKQQVRCQRLVHSSRVLADGSVFDLCLKMKYSRGRVIGQPNMSGLHIDESMWYKSERTSAKRWAKPRTFSYTISASCKQRLIPAHARKASMVTSNSRACTPCGEKAVQLVPAMCRSAGTMVHRRLCARHWLLV